MCYQDFDGSCWDRISKMTLHCFGLIKNVIKTKLFSRSILLGVKSQFGVKLSFYMMLKIEVEPF